MYSIQLSAEEGVRAWHELGVVASHSAPVGVMEIDNEREKKERVRELKIVAYIETLYLS